MTHLDDEVLRHDFLRREAATAKSVTPCIAATSGLGLEGRLIGGLEGGSEGA